MYDLVKLNSIPVVSRVGYTRSTTYRDFLLIRGWHMAWGYLVLDFCSVAMMKDPYFIIGPEATFPLPSYLAALPPWLLEVYRSALFFAGVLAALFMILSFDQVVRCLVLGTTCLGVRGDLWQYPLRLGPSTTSWTEDSLASGAAGGIRPFASHSQVRQPG